VTGREDFAISIPYDRIAELDVLVGMTRDAYQAAEIVALVDKMPAPFYDPSHQGIYAGLTDLTERDDLGSEYRVDGREVSLTVPGLADAITRRVGRTLGSPHDLVRRFERLLLDHTNTLPVVWVSETLKKIEVLAERRKEIATAYATLQREARPDAVAAL
jgi:hypothetical protein